jgi:4-diphosphocytidyl-2-C-methyl-D-erythritol kinase
VNAPLVEKAPAKINLTLRVLGRRADGYHELESLVAFAELTDTLTLQPGGTTALNVSGPIGPTVDNLVLKAVAALRQHIDGLKAGRFLLEKNIPVAAGIGGGSADAAAALRLLARLNGIALDDPRLMAAALLVGADVPVCLACHARIMRGWAIGFRHRSNCHRCRRCWSIRARRWRRARSSPNSLARRAARKVSAMCRIPMTH